MSVIKRVKMMVGEVLEVQWFKCKPLGAGCDTVIERYTAPPPATFEARKLTNDEMLLDWQRSILDE